MTPELMDAPSASLAELHLAFRFIRRINGPLGGSRAASSALATLLPADPPDPLRILDVATGCADIPLHLLAWASARNINLEITAIDLHPATLEIARESARNHPEITILNLDAAKLLNHFPPAHFHVAHTGMFLHHLPDHLVIHVLRSMAALSSLGVIWNDLIRSAFTRLAVLPLTLSLPPLVKHDARVSIINAFSRSEVLAFAHHAGFTSPRYRAHLLHRFTLTARTNPSASRA